MDWRTLTKYGIVGASGVVVNTVALYSLTEFVGVHYLMSGTVAAELSIISNFILNDLWTFSQTDAKHPKWKRFLIYNSISAIGTVILLACMYALTEHFGAWYIFANWVGVIVVFVINYLLNKRLTWSDKNGT